MDTTKNVKCVIGMKNLSCFIGYGVTVSHDSTIFLASGDNGMIAYTYSGFLGLDPNISIVPGFVYLSQNFPNPFNPSTAIHYKIPKFGFVELIVYNLNGELVETLVKQKQNQGEQNILWHSKNLSSGMYFYQLKLNGDIIGTKQAILVK